MICNSTGPVNAQWAAPWGLVDIDWNSDKVDWSKAQPMVSASAARDARHRAALRWCRRPPSLPSRCRPCATVQNNEENMLANVQAIRAVNPDAITWVYR